MVRDYFVSDWAYVAFLLCTFAIVCGLSFGVGYLSHSPSFYDAFKTRYVLPSSQCAGVPFSSMTWEGPIVGESMAPALMPGDTFFVTSFNASRGLVPGDIVTMSDINSTHRVIGVYDQYFLTAGDNNVYDDPERHPYSAITGVVCGWWRGGVTWS